ncbi:probable cyclin-dependent serine/threonine-protein kinase DDB_G0292550 [Hermetia illucens]|uniref:probable cyclin-dependent serine/threonine-protein kinase DDB_G0292550 n=1 Tax=Hermetia illucens TaxID=343691 RepID=UPI0018CC22CA|nr:probable cyclin-dependent serine/threonine-protein kinase DDB_G0292550 [Hermetia illucens]
MAEQVQHLQHQIQEREQQIHQLAEALEWLTQQQQSAENRHRIMKEIQFMSCFTGSGPVSVNAFIKNVEYYLNNITDPNARKAATRAIYQEKIQGEAKNAVMGLPEPDNWDDIKSSLKLRYRPELEPAEIYRQITNLRGDTVSDLAIDILNLKYKAEEIILYYENDMNVDLNSAESLLVNVVKEMTQGVLLEKIYSLKSVNEIVKIMRERRFEDSCIRPEFRKTDVSSYNNHFNNKKHKNKFRKNWSQNNSQDNPKYQGNPSQDIRQNDQNTDNRQYNNREEYNVSNSNSQNTNETRNHNPSRKFKANYRQGNSRQYSNTRKHQQVEPMEVDNIQNTSLRKPSSNSRQPSELDNNSNEGGQFFIN